MSQQPTQLAETPASLARRTSVFATSVYAVPSALKRRPARRMNMALLAALALLAAVAAVWALTSGGAAEPSAVRAGLIPG